MSTKTESAETATTVPSICLLPSPVWRGWACSYSAKILSKDSVGSVVGVDSGVFGFDMKDYGLVMNVWLSVYARFRMSGWGTPKGYIGLSCFISIAWVIFVL